jgi:hypothetical protein
VGRAVTRRRTSTGIVRGSTSHPEHKAAQLGTVLAGTGEGRCVVGTTPDPLEYWRQEGGKGSSSMDVAGASGFSVICCFFCYICVCIFLLVCVFVFCSVMCVLSRDVSLTVYYLRLCC